MTILNFLVTIKRLNFHLNHSRFTKNKILSIILTIILFCGVTCSLWAVPNWFVGYVKTPQGKPIQDAHVWFRYIGNPYGMGGSTVSCYDGSYGDYYNNVSCGYPLWFMPGYYRILLSLDKVGYEFKPEYIEISKYDQNIYLYRQDFTGIECPAFTSGKLEEHRLVSGEMSYGYINIPPGAIEWRAILNSVRQVIIIPTYRDWPAPPSARHIENQSQASKSYSAEIQEIIINASSNPPIQAGKWYIGLYAAQDTDCEITTLIAGPGPDPVISGRVLNKSGEAVQGAIVFGNNSATSDTTDSQGNYTITVPYYWSGNVMASYEGGRFAPLEIPLQNIDANRENIDFAGGLMYPLDISSSRGEVAGAGWYDEGAVAVWSVTNYLSGAEGERFVAEPSGGQEIMNEPKKIEIYWSTQYRFQSSVNPPHSGRVVPLSAWIAPPNSILIEAQDLDGWIFEKFTGDISGDSPAQTILMDSPKNVVAHFKNDNPPPFPGDRNVPGQYGTIQAAIDAAIEGDEIWVQPGSYGETLFFKGKNVVLRSYDPENPDVVAATIINGISTNQKAMINFAGTETDACRLEGFTIKGAQSYNSAIFGNGTHARIAHNIITENRAIYIPGYSGTGGPGGINDCDGVIEYNIIYKNSGEFWCAGLFQCDGIIRQCDIKEMGGSESNGVGMSTCNALIDNCRIFQINGGGISDCNARIVNCLIYNNNGYGLSNIVGEILNCNIIKNTNIYGSTITYSAGIYMCKDAVIANCILWGNKAYISSGDPISMHQIYWTSPPQNCCIQDWDTTQSGCIYTDPSFVDLYKFDLRLKSNSPCIDVGKATPYTYDFRGFPRPFDGDGKGAGTTGDGSDFDIGPYEYAVSSTLLDAPVITPEPALTAGTTNEICWSPVNGALKFRIECSPSQSFPSAGLEVLEVTSPTLCCTFQNLNDLNYYYRVCGLDYVETPGNWSGITSSLQDSTPPLFEGISANPHQAIAGSVTIIEFFPSEELISQPEVLVNDHPASFQSVEGGVYRYSYSVSLSDPVGPAIIKISGTDRVRLSGLTTNNDALIISIYKPEVTFWMLR